MDALQLLTETIQRLLPECFESSPNLKKPTSLSDGMVHLWDVVMDSAINMESFPGRSAPIESPFNAPYNACDFIIRLDIADGISRPKNRCLFMRIYGYDKQVDLLGLLNEYVNPFLGLILVPLGARNPKKPEPFFKTTFTVWSPRLEWHYPLVDGPEWWATLIGPDSDNTCAYITHIKCEITPCHGFCELKSIHPIFNIWSRLTYHRHERCFCLGRYVA